MPREKDNESYLWDMLNAARMAMKFTKGYHFDKYIRNPKTQLAVERALEIIGEAARHISPAYKLKHPEIPWQKIVRHRHVLAHEYGEIKHERIWDVIKKHVPELIAQLQPLVPPVDLAEKPDR